MATTEDRVDGGRLADAVSRAMVGVYAKSYGKGPPRCKTFVLEDVIVCLLFDVLTVGETTLVQLGRADSVRQTRDTFQYDMEPEFREAVERLTGRRVVSFLSATDPHASVASETFVLAPADGATPDLTAR